MSELDMASCMFEQDFFCYQHSHFVVCTSLAGGDFYCVFWLYSNTKLG